MKNTLVVCTLVTLIAFGFSSCKKCYSCEFNHNEVRELCSKDLPDGNAGLMLTIEGYEAQGYKCTRK
jgi:hypothetical protein